MAGRSSPRRPRRRRRRQRHLNGSATATATSGNGNGDGDGRCLFPPFPWRRHFRRIPCPTAAARRRDDGAMRAAAVASELFVHAVPSLCCVRSTMMPTGQPVGVVKCLVTLTFRTSPIRLVPKTRISGNLRAAVAVREFDRPQIL